MSTTIHNPSEPWRYRCPFCGTTSIVKRTKKSSKLCKEHQQSKSMGSWADDIDVADFICDRCYVPFDEPHDMKDDCRCVKCEPDNMGPNDLMTES